MRNPVGEVTIKIGELKDLGKALADFQGKSKIVLLADSNIPEEFVEICCDSLCKAGFNLRKINTAGGEACKNIEKYLGLINMLIAGEVGREDLLVILGGGSLCDLGGFVAATYLRGIRYVQIPSTLLAMVDSSIGSKTGINIDAGKNLVGAFYTPELVFRDIRLLNSLEQDVFRDGFGEVIKYAMLSKRVYDLIAGEADLSDKLNELISECTAYKLELVKMDFEDKGLRKLLNFGHTFGHAIEKASDYKVSHGIAVTKGMALIGRISAGEGWCTKEVCDCLDSLLERYGYEADIEYGVDELMEYIKRDKKRSGDYIDIVIPSDVHECSIKTMYVSELERLAKRYIK